MKRKYLVRSIKRGRRNSGGIYELPSGARFYLAWRKQADLIRFGEKTNSDAIVTDKAAWAIDEDTLLEVRLAGISIVGVLVKETNDVYLTPLANYQDREKTKVPSYNDRNGALQRALPLTYFEHRMGKIKIK